MTSYEEINDSCKKRKPTLYEKLKGVFTFERVTPMNVVICTIGTIALLSGLLYVYICVI